MRHLAGKDCGEFVFHRAAFVRLFFLASIVFAPTASPSWSQETGGQLIYNPAEGLPAGVFLAKAEQAGGLELWGAGKQSLSGYDVPVVDPLNIDSFFPPSIDSLPLDRPGVADLGQATGITQNGDMAVGFLDNGPGTTFHAFTWTAAGGLVDIGTLDPANNASRTSFAHGVSVDGSVVVGYSNMGPLGYNHAFRWTPGGGMAPLDPAAADNSTVPQSLAYSVSGDGTTIVGQRNFRAFRWTETGGFAGLGNAAYFANAASADGAVIVGQTTSGEAFRWTADGGVAPLGVLAGDSSSMAMAVSADGNVIVGISSTSFLGRSGSGNSITFDPTQSRAFYWTADGGMQDLTQLLTAAGADLDGGKLAAATSISADGTWFAGGLTLPATPNKTHTAFATLSVESTEPIAGDYNHDGSVDAADYTVWRDTFGMTGDDLDADGSGTDGVPDGAVDAYDYALWKANFGMPDGSGAASRIAVPEPQTCALLIIGFYLLTGATGRRKAPVAALLPGDRSGD